MAVEESRLKDGELKLGTAPSELDFSCQIINARVNSAYDDDGDAQETLCGDQVAVGRKLSGRSLAGTFIQDWTLPEAQSITLFCYAHDLEELAFSYTPNGSAGPSLTGTLRVEVPGETFGGDVNTRVTSDFEWQMTTALTITPPVAGTEAQTQSEPEPQLA